MKLGSQSPAARAIGWLPLLFLPLIAFAAYSVVQAWVFMWTLAISIYLGLKWLTWWKARNLVPHTAWRSAAYLLAWPGMDAQSFLDENTRGAPPQLQNWCWAIAETGAGVMLLWAIARVVPERLPLLRGWVGMLGLIFVLHFGMFRIIALFWQNLGVNAVPLMSAPLRSVSLSEFWGRRWNLGFRQLAYDLVFGPLHKSLGVTAAGLLVFGVSGLVHDLVISVPARGGYGLPTAYFVLQGFGVMLERSRIGRQLHLREGFRGRLFMVLFTSGPVFWLFHPPFVTHVIIPFMKAIKAL